ncbi:MAG TPA: TRAP transporter small permease [Bradyrhizobium sp.]|nr:TRAP transporter small permease [Bradyrhizobium sp.]
MERLHRVAHGVSRVGAIAGGAMLLVASILICVDIVLRYAFAMTLGGADELSGYALAISSAWGFSATLLNRSHIRIDTVYVRVGPRARATLDLVSLACFALVIGLIAWHGWGVLKQSYVSGSRSLSELETPLIVPQALWFAGLAFFVAVALLLLCRALSAYLTSDFAKLFDLIGSKSAVAEAEEEVRATVHAMESERRE